MSENKINGIIDLYSKSKGSIQIKGVWYSPDNSILNDTIKRANSGEFRKGLMAELTISTGNIFTNVIISNPENMSTKTFVDKLSVNDKKESFGTVVLTDDNFNDLESKGKLMLKLAISLRDEYKNNTGKVELKDGEFEIINSVLKAILWGK